jgi:hypothetical protein
MSAHKNVILLWGHPAPPAYELFIFASQVHAEVQEPLFTVKFAAHATLHWSEQMHAYHTERTCVVGGLPVKKKKEREREREINR